jgi:hypothetical protein
VRDLQEVEPVDDFRRFECHGEPHAFCEEHKRDVIVFEMVR